MSNPPMHLVYSLPPEWECYSKEEMARVLYLSVVLKTMQEFSCNSYEYPTQLEFMSALFDHLRHNKPPKQVSFWEKIKNWVKK